MNTQQKIFNVCTAPERNGRTDVITSVEWGVEFSRNGFTSLAYINTSLPTDDLSSFTPVTEVQKEQLLAWCMQVEAPILGQLSAAHERQLTEMERRSGTGEYTGSLAFVLDTLPGGNEVAL